MQKFCYLLCTKVALVRCYMWGECVSAMEIEFDIGETEELHRIDCDKYNVIIVHEIIGKKLSTGWE